MGETAACRGAAEARPARSGQQQVRDDLSTISSARSSTGAGPEFPKHLERPSKVSAAKQAEQLVKGRSPDRRLGRLRAIVGCSARPRRRPLSLGQTALAPPLTRHRMQVGRKDQALVRLEWSGVRSTRTSTLMKGADDEPTDIPVAGTL